MLSHFSTHLRSNIPEGFEIFADLPNFWLNGSTIPADILCTSQRPDIVIIDRKKRHIELLELTCSIETNIESANLRKTKNYNDLKGDLQNQGWNVALVPFEVGSRGLITRKNRDSLIQVFKRNTIKLKHTALFRDLAKISLLCSYSIFQAHCVPTWKDPPFLHP